MNDNLKDAAKKLVDKLEITKAAVDGNSYILAANDLDYVKDDLYHEFSTEQRALISLSLAFLKLSIESDLM